MKDKITILILAYYLPGNKVGGPLVSILNLIKNLSETFDFNVITPDRDFGENTPYPSIESNKWLDLNGIPVFYLALKPFALFVLLNQIRKKTDEKTIIYLNSVFNSLLSISVVLYKRVGFLKKSNIIIAPRGE